jgi:hypothetical protein
MADVTDLEHTHNPTFEQLVLSWEARNASTTETRPDP